MRRRPEFPASEADPTTHRSRRLGIIPRPITIAAFTASMSIIAACNSIVDTTSNKQQPSSVSLAAEHAVTPLPTNLTETPCIAGIKPITPGEEVLTLQDRLTLTSRIQRRLQPRTLDNTVCYEDYSSPSPNQQITVAFERWDGTRRNIQNPDYKRIRFQKAAPQRQDTFQIQTASKDDQVLRTDILITPEEAIKNLGQILLANKSEAEYIQYASQWAIFPPDTKWQKTVQKIYVPGEASAEVLLGISQSENLVVVINDRGITRVSETP